MTRKRPCPHAPTSRSTKRRRAAKEGQSCHNPQAAALENIQHAVLSSFYPKVSTLRAFLLAHLPALSRLRRRRLTSYGKQDHACILDICLVGISKQPSPSLRTARKNEFATFTQSQHRATGAFSGKSPRFSMSEIIDFVIWSLFKDQKTHSYRPHHILCHGLSRSAAPLAPGDDSRHTTFLPGIVRQHPNDNLEQLKTKPWADVVLLLGEDAESILSNLFLDCGLFIRMLSGKDNYFQLSGIPIAELTIIQPTPAPKTKSQAVAEEHILQPTRIRFVRNRILYAKPTMNRNAKMKVGLKHVHVLERFPDADRPEHTTHVLKYVFPRQFGLHNVFTGVVDPKETAQPFKDYAFREMEIASDHKRNPTWLPRRLRGAAVVLVRKLQRNHQTCAYSQLLRYYCPIISPATEHLSKLSQSQGSICPPGSEQLLTQLACSGSLSATSDSSHEHRHSENSFLPYSTPPDMVSAFCRATIGHLLPNNTFGTGPNGKHNLQMVMRKIDHFIKMRRFETLSLHQAMQSIRLRSIEWLRLPGKVEGNKLSKSDTAKRVELLQELVYYVFDSILIPLIRSNFYVTESSSYRNRLFYFRHDIWRKLSEPSLAVLRLSMFVPIAPSQVRRTLESRSLGYSHLRLLPKDVGARPITNLRRRQIKQLSGRRMMSPSINTQLSPLFSVLNYERLQDSMPLGSALLSVGDLHSKLIEFKKSVPLGARLYFAKLDIKSCFDSIPQNRLLEIAMTLFKQASYRTTKHAEIKATDTSQHGDQAQLKRRFVGSARVADGKAVFSESSTVVPAARKRRVIFSDTGNHRLWPRRALLKLLQSHIQENMVKVGKKHMIQKDGIPQGSILSSILCSYFYGTFEAQELGFLNSQSCLLLRLIDDFLLVTIDETLAKRFLQVMAKGDEMYGIQVNADKSLANFDVMINGQKVPRLHGSTWFPYCGMRIEMTTLALKKDRDKKDAYVSNALTVDTGSRTGMTLKRKILSSMKIQMHSMLLDMSLNSKEQVMSTVLSNFVESAMKFHQYMVQLVRDKRPSQEFIIRLVQEMISVAAKICLIKSGRRPGIGWVEMCWVGAFAFERVLQRKQSQYREVLIWLEGLRTETESSVGISRPSMEGLLSENERLFHGYVY